MSMSSSFENASRKLELVQSNSNLNERANYNLSKENVLTFIRADQNDRLHGVVYFYDCNLTVVIKLRHYLPRKYAKQGYRGKLACFINKISFLLSLSENGNFKFRRQELKTSKYCQNVGTVIILIQIRKIFRNQLWIFLFRRFWWLIAYPIIMFCVFFQFDLNPY